MYYTDSREPRIGHLEVDESKRNYSIKFPRPFEEDKSYRDTRDGAVYYDKDKFYDSVPSEYRETFYSEAYQKRFNEYKKSIKEEDFVRYLDLLGDDGFFTLDREYESGIVGVGGKESPIQKHAGYNEDLFREYFNNKLNDRGSVIIQGEKDLLTQQGEDIGDINDVQFNEAYELSKSLMSEKELEVLELLDKLANSRTANKKRINKKLVELRGEIKNLYDPLTNKFIDQDWYTPEDAEASENMLEDFLSGLEGNEFTVADLEEQWFLAANRLMALNDIFQNYPGVIKRDGSSVTAKKVSSDLFGETPVGGAFEEWVINIVEGLQTAPKRLDGYNEFMNYRKKLTMELQVLSRALLLNQDPAADAKGGKRKLGFLKRGVYGGLVSMIGGYPAIWDDDYSRMAVFSDILSRNDLP